MNVYKIDTGITYLVAAPDMGTAVAAAWKAWEGCDDPEAIEDSGFSVERVDKKNWPEDYYDEGRDKEVPFAELVASTKEPGILTCSEW